MSNAPLNEMREIQKLLNQLVGMVCSMPAEMRNAMREQLELPPIVTDYLTGAYNLLFFYEVLRRETGRADRHSTPLCLLIADIDIFKFINDTFGHVVGNKVLTQVAKTIGHTNAIQILFSAVVPMSLASYCPAPISTSLEELRAFRA
jgi:PleD family two-component response regulator